MGSVFSPKISKAAAVPDPIPEQEDATTTQLAPKSPKPPSKITRKFRIDLADSGTDSGLNVPV